MKEISLLFISIIYSIGLIAQTSLPKDVPSPNASDLGRYGDIPVSYFNGRPEIKIPLYSLSARGVTLPVTLNHDASGVLVNSLPGWTGHNWTLDAGGCITRVAYGFYDDRGIDDNMFPGYNNYFETYSALSSHLTAADEANNYSWLKEHVNRYKNDLAPDIYFFNFMGHSGRFFLGNDGEWKVACDENIEVIFDYTDTSNFIRPFISIFPGGGNQPRTIKGFTLRDENGTKYIFGGDTDHIEYTGWFFNMSEVEADFPWIANTWYLKRVEDRLGNELYSFEYERGKFIAHIFYQAISVSYYASNSAFLLPSGGGGFYNNYHFPYGIQLIAPIYLKSIQSSAGEKLVFHSSDWGVSPSTLYPSFYTRYGPNISDALRNYVTPNTQNKMAFYYLQTDNTMVTPYQYNPTSHDKLTDPLKATCLRELHSITKRTTSASSFESTIHFQYTSTPKLHLTGLIFRNGIMAVDHKYNFKYNHYELLPVDYLTTAIDHWGYFRGYYSEQEPTNFSDYYYSRNPVPTCTQYGLLTEITYPTGGITKFFYEQNDFSKYQADDRLSMKDTTGVAYAGGVRIQRIENYENGENSSCLQRRTFSYNSPYSSTSSGELFAKPKYYWPNWRGKTLDGSATSFLTLFCTSAILPLSNSFGSPIGYSYVTETFDDETKVVYNYSNLSDARDQYMAPNFSWSCPTPYDAYSDRGYKRAKLLSVMIYNGIVLKKKTEYIYRTDIVENNFVYSCNIGANNYGTSASTVFFTGGVYKLFYPKYDVKYENTTTYEDNGTIFDRKTYNRRDYHFPVSFGSYSHWANARLLTSEVTERQNYSQQTLYEYANMSTDTVTKKLLSQQFYLLPTAVEKRFLGNTVSKTETLFSRFDNGLILPRCKLQYIGSTADTLVSYYSYTPTGAVKRYKKQGEPVTALSWWMNDNYLLYKNVGKNLQTSYTYDSLYCRLTRITQPNGNYESYTYDNMGRLSEIRDRNGKLKKKFTYNYQNK